MKKHLLWSISLMLAVLAAPLTSAGPRTRAITPGPAPSFETQFPFDIERFRQYLDLTDAQIAELARITRAVTEKNEPHRNEIRETMAAAAQILLASPQNVDGARAVLRQQEDAEEALRANLLQAVADALQVLTPQQRIRLSMIVDWYARAR